ncbi:MAG: DUF4118 domain-containing protein [Xanthomonadales bacterium]|nr:DUF4118 domain-containing protein [Xanthomonadales bacterium]
MTEPVRHLEYRQRFDRAAGLLLAVGASLAAVGIAAVAERWLGLADLSLVFMLAVLLVASRTRTGPALATAVLCFLAYNFFFIAPRYTFYIDARHGIVTVSLFLAAALLAGGLASRLAMQVDALERARRHAEAREALVRRLSSAEDDATVLRIATDVFRDVLDADLWLRADVATARDGVDEQGWWFLPLGAGEERLGTLGLKFPGYLDRVEDGPRRLARALADDVAGALRRLRLQHALDDARLAHERERLRAALLSSVSHDLRSPLAAILGAAGALESYGERLPADERGALLETVRQEGERLDRYIQNLLDMTRIDHGALSPVREWIGVDELVGAAAARLRRYRPDALFASDLGAAPALIRVHPALFEQALLNLLDNAAKFSPPGRPVRVRAGRDAAGATWLDVIDAGPGIPAAERAHVFDPFHTAERGDRGRDGVGLGLAIARGIVEAHGGRLEALDGDDGVGARLRIVLPADAPPEAEDDA